MTKAPPGTKFAMRLLTRADGQKPLFVGTVDEIVEQMRLNNDGKRVRELDDQEYMAYATTQLYKQGGPPPRWDPFKQPWSKTDFLIYLATLGAVEFEGDTAPDDNILKMQTIRKKLENGELKSGADLKALVESMGGTVAVMTMDDDGQTLHEIDADDLDDLTTRFVALQKDGSAKFKLEPKGPTIDPETETDLITQARRAAEKRPPIPKGLRDRLN